jgi:hypothetical protein
MFVLLLVSFESNSTEVLKQGQKGLQDTVRKLNSDQKEALLKNATVWNCNSKNCHPAQVRL